MSRTGLVQSIAAVWAAFVIVAGCSAAASETPKPSPSRAVARPSPTTDAAAKPSPSARPALTETHTSTIHGLSIAYPAGWIVRAATEPWPPNGIVKQESAFGDIIEDGSPGGTAFIAVASQPVSGDTFDRWAADYLALEECGPSEPITVDGASGIIGLSCPMALVSVGDRGYLILVYPSDHGDWLKEILATVQLQPEDAADAAR